MVIFHCYVSSPEGNHFNHVHRFWRSVFDHRNLVRLSFGIHHPGFWASKLVSSALNLLVGYQKKHFSENYRQVGIKVSIQCIGFVNIKPVAGWFTPPKKVFLQHFP